MPLRRKLLRWQPSEVIDGDHICRPSPRPPALDPIELFKRNVLLTEHAELNRLYHVLHEATLFEGERTVRIRPMREVTSVEFEQPQFNASATVVADLGRDACLAVGSTRRGPYVVRLDRRLVLEREATPDDGIDDVTGLAREPRIVPPGPVYDGPLADVPLVGRTFIQVLHRLIERQGEELPVTGRLLDVLEAR
jgi:hypothetical protein